MSAIARREAGVRGGVNLLLAVDDEGRGGENYIKAVYVS